MNHLSQPSPDQPPTVTTLGNAIDLVKGWDGGVPDGGIAGGHRLETGLEDD